VGNLVAMPAIPPISPVSKSVALAAVLSVVALGVSACDSGSFQGELPPCRCEVETCSAASCPIEISFDPTCQGEIALAEVMVDDHVEVNTLSPGGRLVTCSRIEPDTSSTIFVRGGPWIWGPLVERCSTPRETRALVLQCVEAR